MNKLSKDAADWVISAVDPFHDFEHPIQGAPDSSITKSYTRKFSQTATVAASADDDNISFFFWGCHGASDSQFYYCGPDYSPDPLPVGTTMSPIQVYRASAAVGQPNLGRAIAGTATSLAKFYTRQVAEVPSRLVSLGVEVVDTTQQLYKRGTLIVAHSNGEVEEGSYQVPDVNAAPVVVSFFRKPGLATTSSQAAAIPGTYIGPLAKGCYVQARLNNIQPPRAGRLIQGNGTSTGTWDRHPILTDYENTTPPLRSTLALPTSDSGMTDTWAEFNARACWHDSGFVPFSILITGVSSETTLQITVKATVEYFPAPSHAFECGLATFSPVFEPEAFRIYHEIMRQIPAAVPVGMNASGDYWKMVIAAMRRLPMILSSNAGTIISLADALGKGIGVPGLGTAARAIAAGATVATKMNKRQKPKQ